MTKSHKARGVKALLQRGVDVPQPTLILSEYNGKLPLVHPSYSNNFEWFVRGCPPTPQAGNSRYRSFRTYNIKDAEKYYQELQEADPDSDVIVQPYVEAAASAVLHLKHEYIDVGFGHAGVTAGSSPFMFRRVYNGSACSLLKYLKFASYEEFGTSDCALEFVMKINETMSLVDVYAVQIRDMETGVSPICLSETEFCGDLRGRDPRDLSMVVLASEDVAGKTPDFLLSYDTNRTLFVFRDISPLSHFVAAAAANPRISWVLADERLSLEKVGNLVQKSDGVLSLDTKGAREPIEDLRNKPFDDEEKFWTIVGARVGLEYLKDPAATTSPLPGSLLNWRSVFLLYKDRHVRNAAAFHFGLTTVLAIAAALGELRYYSSQSNGTGLPPELSFMEDVMNMHRHTAYQTLLPKVAEVVFDRTYGNEVLKSVTKQFYYNRWNPSYGGRKWASCTKQTRKLFDLFARNFAARSRPPKRWQIYRQLDIVENMSHNTGLFLSKFAGVEVFTEATSSTMKDLRGYLCYTTKTLQRIRKLFEENESEDLGSEEEAA